MPRGLDSVVMGMVVLASLRATATELKYVWRTDAVERYRYEETVHWKGGAVITVHAQLAERVRAVRRDGRGSVELTLEALDVSFGKQSFDLRAQVPAQERVIVVADAKGHFAVPDTWRVGLRDGRPVVELRAAGAGEIAKASQMIDVVPRRLLGLLALPEGTLERGRVARVRNGRQTLQWRLAALDGPVATLYVSDAAAAPSTSAHSVTQPPKKEAADLVVRFDGEQGRLIEVRGTLIWTQSTRANSRVLMQRLPPADYTSR
jgi:hypothetical protein